MIYFPCSFEFVLLPFYLHQFNRFRLIGRVWKSHCAHIFVAENNLLVLHVHLNPFSFPVANRFEFYLCHLGYTFYSHNLYISYINHIKESQHDNARLIVKQHEQTGYRKTETLQWRADFKECDKKSDEYALYCQEWQKYTTHTPMYRYKIGIIDYMSVMCCQWVRWIFKGGLLVFGEHINLKFKS